MRDKVDGVGEGDREVVFSVEEEDRAVDVLVPEEGSV